MFQKGAHGLKSETKYLEGLIFENMKIALIIVMQFESVDRTRYLYFVPNIGKRASVPWFLCGNEWALGIQDEYFLCISSTITGSI